MTEHLGHRTSLHLVDAEAYRRVMAGQLPATLSQFAGEIADWFRQSHPDAAPLTEDDIKTQIDGTWHRRHDLIRGG